MRMRASKEKNSYFDNYQNFKEYIIDTASDVLFYGILPTAFLCRLMQDVMMYMYEEYPEINIDRMSPTTIKNIISFSMIKNKDVTVEHLCKIFRIDAHYFYEYISSKKGISCYPLDFKENKEYVCYS